MDDIQTWLMEGRQYLSAAAGTTKKFNLTIRYNLLAMAFEKFVMAILMHYGTLPENHTFSDLLAGLEQVMEVSPEMKRTIIRLESAQEICSFTDCFRRELDENEIALMKDMVESIRDIADVHCR